MTTSAQLLDYADDFDGYVEGPKDNETHPFGDFTGAQYQPWCHSYVSFILDHMGLGMGKIAYCPTGVSYWRDRQRLYTLPQSGDVFYLWFPSKNRYAHTGFVKGVSTDGWIITQEGNSNKAGSRTGGQCVSLRRKYTGTRTVFGRPAYAVPAPVPTGNPKAIVRVLDCPTGGKWTLQADGGVITSGAAPFLGSYFSLPKAMQNDPNRRFKTITPFKGGYALVSTKNEWYHFPR